jgi:hypothetical protein
MEISLLHKLSPAYKERIHALYLLMGMKSASGRWMQLVKAQARSTHSGSADPAPGLMYFILGTIAFSRHFDALTDEAYQLSLAATTKSAGAPARSDLRGLLR